MPFGSLKRSAPLPGAGVSTCAAIRQFPLAWRHATPEKAWPLVPPARYSRQNVPSRLWNDCKGRIREGGTSPASAWLGSDLERNEQRTCRDELAMAERDERARRHCAGRVPSDDPAGGTAGDQQRSEPEGRRKPGRIRKEESYRSSRASPSLLARPANGSRRGP